MCFVVGAVAFGACRDTPSDAELDRLRAEAIAANAAATRAHAATDAGANLTLWVGGRVGKPPAVVSGRELAGLATAHVVTTDAQNPTAKTPTDFTGVLVRDLLDRFAAAPDADEVTFVSADAFRATVRTADARAYRMLLATAANGAPIPSDKGGPIYLVHPYTESPAVIPKYPDRFWAFYVTHVVVGTEEPRLVIGDKTLDRAAIDAMPHDGFDGPIGFKVEWPSGQVHLSGVRLVDALAAAGVALPPHGTIVVRGKAPLHDDPRQPVEFRVDDLPRCKPILALRTGADEHAITARFGGPIVLAYTPCGDRYGTRHWVTFVENIQVKP